MNAPVHLATNITAPDGQDEGTTSRVARWLKAVGEAVVAHEPLVELETDKVALEVAAPASGVLSEILVSEGSDVAPGAILGRIGGKAVPAAVKAVAQEREPRLSPLVRRLLALHGVKPDDIAGTGIGGRIRRDDVLAFVDARGDAQSFVDARGDAQSFVDARGDAQGRKPDGRSHFIPHDRMRLTIARHMTESLLHTTPHVTSVFEADFTRIIAHRARHKADFARQGVKLTFTAYFVAASVEAIAAVPAVNARFHENALEIFDDANIGVGTALGNAGLIVPVIKRAQTLSLAGIAEQLQALTDKARDNRLAPEDVRGGTFTISNHGVSGSLLAAPIIINQPQSAILGIGKLEKRLTVVTVDDQDMIQIRPRAYVTLTIDHRALDGFQTNSFLSKLVEVIENWPEDRL